MSVARSLPGGAVVSLALALVAACSEVPEDPSVVVLDPGSVDLGGVYPTQEAERKLTVADLSAPRSLSLTEASLSGPGSEWMEVRPIVPLPADLTSSVPVEVAVYPPLDAPVGTYQATLTVRGGEGDEAFERTAIITFDVEACDRDGDGDLFLQCGGGDCDDDDPSVSSLAVEACNGIDDDCNGLIDDAADRDGDGFSICEDCDDSLASVFPGARERCNGIDDDCDGRLSADELDGDGDGVAICDGDCNDLDRQVFPGARERCNGIDDDCDGLLDDAEDQDDDSFTVCDDCDDLDRFVFPGAPERCNGIDDDCDGALPPAEADADGDGVRICDLDCDDGDAEVFPGAEEVCDGVDQDCDEVIDEDGACPCDRVERDGHVYLFCDTDETWAAARATCGGYNYDLLTIDDSAEDAFAFDEVLRVDDTRKWWFGYTDQRVEGTWLWEDGTPSGYENWGPGEPNDTGGGEDCAQLNRYTDGGWNDEPCGARLPYVCELD